MRVFMKGKIENTIEDLSREKFRVSSGFRDIERDFRFPVSVLRVKNTKSIIFRGSSSNPKFLGYNIIPWPIPISRG